MKYSIIVPCAGNASRLNIPFSKSLFPLKKGVVLIDHLFDIFYDYKSKIKFVFIINEFCLDIVSYLYKYSTSFNFCFIFQKQSCPGMFGAVESAKEEFSDYNLVLLPDTILHFGFDKNQYFPQVVSQLKKHDLVFTISTNLSEKQLFDEGVVFLSSEKENTIIEIIDKPHELIYKPEYISLKKGAWVSVAFSSSISDDILITMQKNILGTPFSNLNFQLLKKAGIVTIDNFYDLGVWSRIYEYFSR